MKQPINTCIVVPCYNEEKRLPLDEYDFFLSETPQVLICFVNDGSLDNTFQVLQDLKKKHHGKVDLVSYPDNAGKGEAVRRGIHFCNKNYNHSFVGYLDADLATSLEECMTLIQILNPPIEFCFGSRIRRVGSIIQRKTRRWIIGRLIATIISHILQLHVYDTQCGCKFFTKNLSLQLFESPFISRWLFDVEIFFRMFALYGRDLAIGKMVEIPLSRWIDRGVSSVKVTYFFKLWIDLVHIYKRYNTLRAEKT